MGGFLSKSKKLERSASGRNSNKSKSKKEKAKDKERRSTIGAPGVENVDLPPEQRQVTASINRRRSFGNGLFKSNSGKGNEMKLSRASEIPVRKAFIIEDQENASVKGDKKDDDKFVYVYLAKDTPGPSNTEIDNKEVSETNQSLNDELKLFKPLKPVANSSLDKTKRRRSISSSRLSLNSKKDHRGTVSSLSSYDMPKDHVSVSSNRLDHVNNLQGMKQELRNSIQNVIESMKPAEVKCVPLNRESAHYASYQYPENVKKRSLDKYKLRPVSNIYDSVSFNSTFTPEKIISSAKSTEVINEKQTNERINREETGSKYYETDEIAYAVVNISDIKDPVDEKYSKNVPAKNKKQPPVKEENREIDTQDGKQYQNVNFPQIPKYVNTLADPKKENERNGNDLKAKLGVIESKDKVENLTKKDVIEPYPKVLVEIPAQEQEVNEKVDNDSSDESDKGNTLSKNNYWDIYSEDSLDELSDSSDDDEDASWTYKNFNSLTNKAGRSRAPIVYEDESDSSVEYVNSVNAAEEKKKDGSVKKSLLTRNRGELEKPSKWATKEQAEIYTRDCQLNGPTAPYTGYVIPRVKPVYSSKKHRREEHQHHHHQHSGEDIIDHDDWSSERGSEQGSVKDKAKIYEKKGMIMGPAEQGRLKDRSVIGSSPPIPPFRIPDPRLHQLEFRSSTNFDGSRPQRVKSLGPMKAERMALVTKDILHCGNVRVVKKAENGVKIPKQWHDNFVILKSDKLIFYDSEKAWRDQHLHRFDIILKDGLVDLENVKKRIKIVDANNDMYVTEHPNEREAKEWMGLIRSNALVIASASQPSPIASPSPTLARHRTKSTSKAASDESVNDIPSTGDSQENIPKNNKTTSKILDKWLRKRPQKDTLINKGIYQDEAVFGRNLWEVCPLERPRIPEFVVRCVRVIEGNVQNMTTDGIYRASGNLSQIQKIRLDVNQKNLSVVNDTVDVHVLTGALKLFFRELKEPLIPFEFFQKALNASCKQDHDSRIKEFREIVRKLPDCNKDTLTFFLEHLLNVTKHEDKNRMKVSNLAIVLGPTILWAPPNATQNLALDFLKQNEVIECLLNDYKLIFQDEKLDGRDQKKFETKM